MILQAAPRAVREFEDNNDTRVMLLLQRTSAAGLTLVRTWLPCFRPDTPHNKTQSIRSQV